MRHVTSFPLHIDLEEGSKLRQSRKKIQKRFFGELPPRIISVQTRRNRSSDRFNLPDSRTPGRRGGAISWRSREQEKKKVRRDSLIVGVIPFTEQRNRCTDFVLGRLDRGENRGEGPRVSWGYFQSIIRPGVGSTPLIVCPRRGKRVLY